MKVSQSPQTHPCLRIDTYLALRGLTNEIYFNGIEDVEKVNAKVELHSAIKDYDGEKATSYLAERLEGPAFDVYMRLPNEDRRYRKSKGSFIR